jgi:trigger factor
MAVIEKMYGPEVFYEDAANDLIMPKYVEAVKELIAQDETFQPIARPEFDIEQIEKGKDFIFKAVVDTKQTIELGEYKGIEVEAIDGEVTEKEIEQYLDMMRGKQATVREVTEADAVVEKWDIANINFTGKKDGIEFEGGAARGYDLTIGSGSFIPGFEEQVEGMKVGETRDINVTFPEVYPAEELAGKAVVFEVTVNAIKRKQLAELNDDFAKDVSNFETLEEYKADIKATLTEEKAAEIQNRYKAEVAQKAAALTDVVAPESMVKAEAENFMNDIRFQFAQQGIALEQYLQLTNGKIEDIENECNMRAESAVKEQLVFEAIAEKEGLEVTDADLDAEFENLSKMYNQPADVVRNMFTQRGQVSLVKRNILMEKVAAFLLENAKIG